MANAILKDGWIYAGDSATDSIAREDSTEQVGGTKYELYGIAVRFTETSLDFAISTNLPASGTTNDEGEIVHPGDLFLNFGDQSSFNAANGSADMYAIHFSDGNEADVGPMGIYSNVTATSVALSNGLGLDGGLTEYNAYVSANGGIPSIGTLPADTSYFNQIDPGNVPNIISGGILVSGGVNPLTQVPDFNVPMMEGVGSNIIGGSVDPATLPQGPFTAHFAPECDNDVIAIEINPDIEITKKTNGFDAKAPGDAVIANPGERIKWTFEVANTGNVAFLEEDVQVVDLTLSDLHELFPELDYRTDVNGDGILSPGETWTYALSGRAANLEYGTRNTTLVPDQKVAIDFEVDAFGNPLAAGTIIDDEYSSLGLTVSQQTYYDGQPQFGAMIFDTQYPTGNDEDLRSDTFSNVLIISEDGDSSNPNDSVYGGIVRFDFDYLVNNFQVGLFDVDGQYDDEALITSYRRLDDGSYQTIDSLRIEGGPGEGYIPEVDLLTNANGFDRIDIRFTGSFAITDLEFDRLVPVFGNTAQVTLNGLAHISDTDTSYYQNGPVYNSPLMQPIALAPTAVI
ncbi:XDD3 family exosortase-dependent surface protein [Leptolyngbya sp. CCNP1308]|uniref:XDD3 family exosortase-dependent surface protein n=1 Tax=Leptolyngbya sp. CCNP1308 TaxID=3110255 RepID=UPI002B2165E8|nr:XDD3 family exosortase-dependent surface protein [Leptolyngbya sp. CCNP1308]MEA5451835.1 XDD3 family exosortase-dependent surface protein [Leptolyngbya sp. CCNP1308]